MEPGDTSKEPKHVPQVALLIAKSDSLLILRLLTDKGDLAADRGSISVIYLNDESRAS